MTVNDSFEDFKLPWQRVPKDLDLQWLQCSEEMSNLVSDIKYPPDDVDFCGGRARTSYSSNDGYNCSPLKTQNQTGS